MLGSGSQPVRAVLDAFPGAEITHVREKAEETADTQIPMDEEQ